MTRLAWSRLFALLAASVLACSAGGASAPDAERKQDPDSRRRIASGELVGFDARGSHAWLGIPFAKPPVGERRWRAPEPPEKWSGVREALQPGSACPQYPNALTSNAGPERDGIVGDEDCLYLNVHAPRFAPPDVPQGKARLPVMVWIHGGGNCIGHGASYDGGALASEQNVIIVTTNYRLGALGWFRHPALAPRGADPRDGSGNYGTLDLIRALEWVRDNVSAFGGDPGNVTIFGESAGGHNVYTLLVAPGARGLFHRAISQSGGTDTDTETAAEAYSDATPAGEAFSSREVVLRLLQREGSAADRASARARADAMSPAELASYLRGKSASELLAVYEPGPFGMYWAPRVFRDGHVLPEAEIADLLADGRFQSVPVMLGTNRDEVKLFMQGGSPYIWRLFWVFPIVTDGRRYDLESEYSSRLWKARGADEPAAAMVAKGHSKVFVYRWDWDEEGRVLVSDLSRLLGASHGFEIAFIFNSYDQGAFTRAFRASPDPESRNALGRAMRDYWAQFARAGDPGRGTRGDLPRWTAWSNQPGAPRFVVLDTPRDGGIRASSESVTRDGVLDALAADARFESSEERCELFANLVRFSNVTPEEYARRGCAEHPLEDVAAR